VIGVHDLAAATARYAIGCGLTEIHPELRSSPNPSSIRLGRPELASGTVLRLVETDRPPSRPAGATGVLGPLGTGFTSSDILSVHARLSRHGVTFLSRPLELTPEPAEEAGPRRFEAFGQTPDGEFIVVVERRNAPTHYGTIDPSSLTSEPLHTSHIVDDLQTCRRFMEEVLDHRVLFTEVCSGEIFEALMSLPPGVSFRFQMLGPPKRDTGRIIFIEMDASQLAQRGDAVSHRGLVGLTYLVDDLDRRVARAVELGATIFDPTRDASDHHLGPGRRAILQPPFNLRLELFEPRE
jgi:catechol 2,3-dioxygenase-like lactoylglutathione lyase family enzyme